MEIKKKTDFLRFFNKNKNRIFAVLAIVTAGTIISQVLAATNITSVVPDNGTSLGGTEIIINGSGFTDYTPAVGTNFTFQSPNGACQQYTIPSDGYYQLETWGAQGGTGGANVGGRGGYSVGTVFMRAGTSTFVCVGGQGTASPRTSTSAYGGGFNGGGASYRNDMGNGRETATGGGGTDIRIGANSLYARAIVAGGGGGASGIQWSNGPGGAGGGLNGTAGNAGVMPGGNGTGASQTAGGTNNASGCTGVGAFGSATNCPFTSKLRVAKRVPPISIHSGTGGRSDAGDITLT